MMGKVHKKIPEAKIFRRWHFVKVLADNFRFKNGRSVQFMVDGARALAEFEMKEW